MVLGLTACGGKNKKGNNENGGVAVGVFNTNTAANTADYGSFVNQVAGGNFERPSTAGSVAQWQRYTNVSDLLNYSGSSSNSGWNFDWCWGSDCFTQNDQNIGARRIGTNQEIYRNNAFAFDSELGPNLQSVLNNLVNKMRSGTNVKKCVWSGWDFYCAQENDFNVGGVPTTRWYFEHGNRAYIVDTKFPLAANPVAVLNKDTNEGFALIQ